MVLKGRGQAYHPTVERCTLSLEGAGPSVRAPPFTHTAALPCWQREGSRWAHTRWWKGACLQPTKTRCDQLYTVPTPHAPRRLNPQFGFS
jgi:hypothetical protein